MSADPVDGAQTPSDRAPTGFSPAQQDSVVPRGWKPSVAAPVPVVRCVTIKANGDRCGRWSIRGYQKCATHLKGAKNFQNFQAHTAAVIEAARLRLVDDADMAIDTLEALLQPGTAEAIRLKASTEILDRVGVRGGFEVDVVVDNTASQVDEIRERLAKLNGSNAVRPELEAAVIDAEVVEDVPAAEDPYEQDTLF